MLSRMFHSYGRLCALYPWELILSVVCLILPSASLSVIPNPLGSCTYFCYNYEVTSHTFLLAVTRVLVVCYVYIQFNNLRKNHAGYVISLAVIYTLFSVFFFTAIVYLCGGDLSSMSAALAYFFLLIDFTHVISLSQSTVLTASHEEIIENISAAVAAVGPSVTLDVLVKVLVVSLGTMSGVHQLDMACFFICIALLSNFITLITFLPACLSLFIQVSHGDDTRRLAQAPGSAPLTGAVRPDNANLVSQRVRIIMCLGLSSVHLTSWLSAQFTVSDALPSDEIQCRYLSRFSAHINDTITVTLCLAVFIKYALGHFWLSKLAHGDPPCRRDKFPHHHHCRLSPFSPASVSPSGAVTDTHERPISERPSIEADHKYANSSSNNISSFTTPLQYDCIAQAEETCLDEKCDKLTYHYAKFTIGGDENDETQGDGRDEEKISLGDSMTRGNASTSDTEAGRECDDTVNKVGGNTHRDQVEKEEVIEPPDTPLRSLDECVRLLQSDAGPADLSDEEVMALVKAKHIPAYKLEVTLGDHTRGVRIRRQLLTVALTDSDVLGGVPYQNYDYNYVTGACCENVVGYIPVPVGVAGPLLLNGRQYHVPMATTEGTLVASTNRGCRAVQLSGGVSSVVIGDGMTRAPVVRLPTAIRASQVKRWLEKSHNFDMIKLNYEATSRFAELTRVQVAQASRHLFIRFVSRTGDAMGMNMVSKGVERALHTITEYFPDLQVISLSGNYCTDKKSAAVNWIEGRGKSVVSEATIPERVVRDVLKTNVGSLLELNVTKNLIGSAMAGSVGGFNAHAANVVTAIFIATGQDPAQNITSSNCMTLMEAAGPTKSDLYISCTMPSVELGTVGGGTVLPPQAACLQMLGVRGSNFNHPGQNAIELAQIVCGTVLAGELSLMSALAAGHLVKSHMQHNRSSVNIASTCSEAIQEPRPMRRHRSLYSDHPLMTRASPNTAVAASLVKPATGKCGAGETAISSGSLCEEVKVTRRTSGREGQQNGTTRSVIGVKTGVGVESEPGPSIDGGESGRQSRCGADVEELNGPCVTGGKGRNIRLANCDQTSQPAHRAFTQNSDESMSATLRPADIPPQGSSPSLIEKSTDTTCVDKSLVSSEDCVANQRAESDVERHRLADECVFSDAPMRSRKKIPLDHTCIPL